MKYKGKAISASSMLTILGVVCFASMIVAAAISLSSLTSGPARDIEDTSAMTITFPDEASSTLPDFAAWSGATTVGEYDQGVTITSGSYSGPYSIYVRVTSDSTDIKTTHITLKYADAGDTTWTDIVLTEHATGNYLEATIPGATIASAEVDNWVFYIDVNMAQTGYLVAYQTTDA